MARGLWKGSISFGLVNIAVQVVSAKERPDLHFMMLDPSNSAPVGYKYYNKGSGEEVKRSDTVKAYEYKSGKYVIFTDADFKKANPKATQTIDIQNFVTLHEIDPVFFEKAYYLLPLKGSEKAYTLLAEALQKTQKVAVAKIVLHTKQHLAAIIPRQKYLLLELLHFAEDVKELRDLDEWKNEVPTTKVNPREIEMAERLVEEMTAKWKPEIYKDTYRADIMKRVNAKVKAGKAMEITEEAAASRRAGEEVAHVVDLMPLLQKSLRSKKTSSHPRARGS
jgi:DNA end-binding protein Ku